MAKLSSLIAMVVILPVSSSLDCKIPDIIRGLWFSWENGRGIQTTIDEQSITGKGYCVDMKQENNVNYTFVFKQEAESCYMCVKILVRTINVVEKIETPCVTVVPEKEASVANVCKDNLFADQQLTTFFEENYGPVNCRASLEGAWQFSYQNNFSFTGDCNHPESIISACPMAVSQFLETNKKFSTTYKECSGTNGTFDDQIEYTCLGDWFEGRKHFIAVANPKEPRKDKKFRCFLKHICNDTHIGASVTPECSTLKTVEESPEKIHLTPLNSELVVPSCTLPQNLSGDWMDTSNLGADIFINETHIVETWSPGEGQTKQIAYVCHQKQDTHYIMARLTFDGCQKSFICFKFVPRHHNVIRYKRGIASITDDFDRVCSWEQYKNQKMHKYNLYLAKKPVPVHCPFTGRFNFTQQGDNLFETQVQVGLTLPLRPGINCKENISELSVCSRDQKEIAIEVSHCVAVDHRGRPIKIYQDIDYSLKCVGFWKENNESYLLTYNERDVIDNYHCWIYQRDERNGILMSQSLGPICDLNQRVSSSNYTEGAAVALELQEYEVEHDHCALHFDDGSNPWIDNVNIKVSNVTKVI